MGHRSTDSDVCSRPCTEFATLSGWTTGTKVPPVIRWPEPRAVIGTPAQAGASSFSRSGRAAAITMCLATQTAQQLQMGRLHGFPGQGLTYYCILVIAAGTESPPSHSTWPWGAVMFKKITGIGLAVLAVTGLSVV